MAESSSNLGAKKGLKNTYKQAVFLPRFVDAIKISWLRKLPDGLGCCSFPLLDGL